MGLQVEGLALTLLVVVLVFLVVSWIVVSLRLWVRVWIKGIGIDDYFMTAGLVSSPSMSAFTESVVADGLRTTGVLHGVLYCNKLIGFQWCRHTCTQTE